MRVRVRVRRPSVGALGGVHMHMPNCSFHMHMHTDTDPKASVDTSACMHAFMRA